jgi:fructose-bisphosphate aldolase/2-amino-3,7-dideoxy-D-threo-hept-6-ulosonate synthase
MNTGKKARISRIGTEGRYLMVPMDHGITMGAVEGLVDIESTINRITAGGADSILTQRGIAGRVHGNLNGAGYIVHLNGSTSKGTNENDKRRTGTVEDAVRVGADAVSFHINVFSEYEPEQIEELAAVTGEAERLGMPTLVMAYARGHEVRETDPEAFAEDLGHAVRLAEELGGDVVKTAYSGSPETFERVVESTSLPVVIAGGSKGTDTETLRMVRGAMDAGAAGVSMGRSIFQHESPGEITRAVHAVIHEDATAEEAGERAGLAIEA